MTQQSPDPPSGTVLLIGASRGLGLGMAGAFARRGWHVVATVREGARTELHDLADAHPDRVAIETVDIVERRRCASDILTWRPMPNIRR